MDLKAFGDLRQDLRKVAHFLVIDRGRGIAASKHRLFGSAEAGPASFEPIRLVRLIGDGGLELLLEVREIFLGPLPDPRLVDHAFGNQALAVDFADRRVLLDRSVHERLSKAWLVALIVAEAAVAPHVDDYVSS